MKKALLLRLNSFEVNVYGELYAATKDSKGVILHPNPSLEDGVIRAFVTNDLEVAIVDYSADEKLQIQTQNIMDIAKKASVFIIKPRALSEHKHIKYETFKNKLGYMTVFTLTRERSPYVILAIGNDVYVAKATTNESGFYSLNRNALDENATGTMKIENYKISMGDYYLWNGLIREIVEKFKSKSKDTKLDYYQYLLAALVYPSQDSIIKSGIASIVYNYNDDISDFALMVMIFPMIKYAKNFEDEKEVNYFLSGYLGEEPALIEL